MTSNYAFTEPLSSVDPQPRDGILLPSLGRLHEMLCEAENLPRTVENINYEKMIRAAIRYRSCQQKGLLK